MADTNYKGAEEPLEIRARFTDRAITVYQAYSEAIALPALQAQRFVPPFKMDRMTWIKPSFLWMMSRSAWGTRPNQEHVLAIEITRDGFDWALRHACLSRFDPNYFNDIEEWRHKLKSDPVRIQWDPERDIRMNRLNHKTIQIGLSGCAVFHYVNDWITSIKSMNPLARKVRSLLENHLTEEATRLLPIERPYKSATNLK